MAYFITWTRDGATYLCEEGVFHTRIAAEAYIMRYCMAEDGCVEPGLQIVTDLKGVHVIVGDDGWTIYAGSVWAAQQVDSFIYGPFLPN